MDACEPTVGDPGPRRIFVYCHVVMRAAAYHFAFADDGLAHADPTAKNRVNARTCRVDPSLCAGSLSMDGPSFGMKTGPSLARDRRGFVQACARSVDDDEEATVVRSPVHVGALDRRELARAHGASASAAACVSPTAFTWSEVTDKGANAGSERSGLELLRRVAMHGLWMLGAIAGFTAWSAEESAAFPVHHERAVSAAASAPPAAPPPIIAPVITPSAITLAAPVAAAAPSVAAPSSASAPARRPAAAKHSRHASRHASPATSQAGTETEPAPQTDEQRLAKKLGH